MTSHDENAGILPVDAERLTAAYMDAFNSGDAERLDRLYEDTGVVVPSPGRPATGAERAAADRYLLGLGLPIDARLRHAYVSGDVALLVVDWSVHGTGADGHEIRIEGTAADVARRGPDGLWRYAVNNPFGTGRTPR
ncbi:nuclear transport factor 2 family protein [Streptosporangium sp. NPDC023615]|uniref:YybH family protein n=1 Tax=Streptosporangium sp. NPDC023615 TaxID=3154794 RepID=UPI003440D362